MSSVYQLSRAAVLSGAIGSIAVPSCADESGLNVQLGFESSGSTLYDVSIPTTSFMHNSILVDEGLMPERLNFSMSHSGGIHASVGWDSRVYDTGSVLLSFGGSIKGSYFREAYVYADFTEERENILNRAIVRLTDEAATAFAPYGDRLGIEPARSREVFNTIATFIVRNPHEIRALSRRELRNLIPDEVTGEARRRIIESVIPAIAETSREVVDSDVIRGLRNLHHFNVNFSDSAAAAAVAVDVYARAELDVEPVAPYLQANIGYQAYGFLTDDRNGALFHGPTASLELGLTGDFNDQTEWEAYVRKPFALEQKGPYGLRTHTSDDISYGVGIFRENNGRIFGVEGFVTPATGSAGAELSLKF